MTIVLLLVVVAILVFVVLKYLVLAKKPQPEKSQKTVKSDSKPAENPMPAILKKLEDQSKIVDELTLNIRSIQEVGQKILSRAGAEEERITILVNVYRGYLEEYLKSAATLVQDYRQTKTYVKLHDIPGLRNKVKEYEARIADGERDLAKTLEETKANVEKLEKMDDSQRTIRTTIEKINATLQNLEASFVDAENDPTHAEKVEAEIQNMLSATSQAVEETMVLAGKK